MATETPISVVIPTHNRRILLERTLRTVLAQQGVEVNLVVVDDGSTDTTNEFLNSFSDERIRAIRNDQALGVSLARNIGLAAVDTDWVGFVDDDDVWAPDHLASLLDAARRIDAGWACSDTVLLDPALAIIGGHHAPDEGDVSTQILLSNCIPGGGSAVAARTELVREAGGFDPSLSPVEDWDLWIRLATTSPIACVSRPHVGYLHHPGNASRNVARMRAALDRLVAKHAEGYRARGVEFDERWWDSYVLAQQRSAGDRHAALTRSRLTVRSRGMRRWVAAAATVIAPSAVESRHRRRVIGALDTGWLEEAEAWLAPLRRDGK